LRELTWNQEVTNVQVRFSSELRGKYLKLGIFYGTASGQDDVKPEPEYVSSTT
jgi:hypothetical protein